MKINEIENNMKNFKSHMTVYYSKTSGKIQTVQTGINDMGGVKDVDDAISLIWDYTIVPLDENVIVNSSDFIIFNGEIRMKPQKPKYQTIDEATIEKMKKEMEAKLREEMEKKMKEQMEKDLRAKLEKEFSERANHTETRTEA